MKLLVNFTLPRFTYSPEFVHTYEHLHFAQGCEKKVPKIYTYAYLARFRFTNVSIYGVAINF